MEFKLRRIFWSLLTVYLWTATIALRPVQKPVVVAGATGYIGRQVVRELVSRDVPCVAMVRSKENLPSKTQACLAGAEVVVCDPLEKDETFDLYKHFTPASTICCLASRSGVKRDSWAVDYGGGKNVMEAQNMIAQEYNQISNKRPEEDHYVLLSAYCVGKPLLEYQFAKLKLEEELRTMDAISHSIVRPTAFFKSLDGQLESARKGNPLLHFGSGDCSANAICEEDLARFLVDCAVNPVGVDMYDATRDVGGPDNPPITKKQQLQLIYETLGIPEEQRRIISLPVGLIDSVIASASAVSGLAKLLHARSLEERCEDAAEIARIVKYYATEPMVAVDEGQIQGSRRLADHFSRIAARGGSLEEIDRMTTTTGVLEVFTKNQYARQGEGSQTSNLIDISSSSSSSENGMKKEMTNQ